VPVEGGSPRPVKKDHLRVRVCSTLVLLSLLLSAPASALGNWGLEVGRANATDVANLAKDWNTYRRNRVLLDWEGRTVLGIERQRQLLGGEFVENLSPAELFLKTEDAFLIKIMGPLQRIAINPASSCPEAQFALVEMIGLQRQQQLLGLEESEIITRVYEATEEMVSLRCRDEALDECLATGRFMQILQLMAGGDRQAKLLGRQGSLESWAVGALEQCAIYELHFVSRTNTRDSGMAGPVEIETVRDGRVQIQFHIPPGALTKTVPSLGDLLHGKNEKNPFFVSVKCKAPQPTGVPPIKFICSPGADSSPIEVRINALDLKHREFYLDTATSVYSLGGFLKERVVGEDKFSFEFEGGEFNLQGLIKVESETVEVPMPGVGTSFYLAHKEDQLASGRLKVGNTKRGAYPVIFNFTYAGIGDTDESGVLSTDSTEFELIHKPRLDPFQKPPEPIRKPLKPAPDK
jgi:hypothetical protein